MLLSVVYRLHPAVDAHLPATLGQAIHGAFFNLVEQADPALARRLHSPSGSRLPTKFTTSPLQGPSSAQDGRISLSKDQAYWLRFTSLDRELSQLLLNLPAERIGCLNLLGVPLEVEQVATEPGQHPWAAHTDFAALYDHWLVKCRRPPRRIGLRFYSPTTFRHDKLNLPFPLPRLIFLTLADKWNAFSPVHLGAEINEAIDDFLEPTRYELRTRVMRFPHSYESGFVGRCEYRLHRATQEGDLLMRIINLLTDFAFYAGVGAKTTMGMGQARRILIVQRSGSEPRRDGRSPKPTRAPSATVDSGAEIVI